MNLSFFEVHQPQSACTVDSVTVCVRVRVCARGAARACAYISLQVSCRDCIARVAHAGWRFENVCKILIYQFKDGREMVDSYETTSNDINNFATNIVYYSPENGIYDQEDNFLWNFNYEITDIPNVTPEVIQIMDDYLQENEEMSLQESIKRILREDKKTKSTNKEFSKYKNSKFGTLKDYTLQDIVDNWDSLSDHKNENIKTIKHFINNPDKITDLVYDEKGLEDGYHRLIAAKILKKPRFTYRLVENLQESIRRILREELNNRCDW